MQPEMLQITYYTSSYVKTVNIITFTQFKEGDLLSESHNGTKNGDESDDSDDYSTLTPFISEAKIDEISSGDESDAEPMPTNMLEDIPDGSQYHPSINRREAHYKIRDRTKQRKPEWKGELLPTQNMGNGSQTVFKAVVNESFKSLPIIGKSGSEVSYFIPEPRNFVEVT